MPRKITATSLPIIPSFNTPKPPTKPPVSNISYSKKWTILKDGNNIIIRISPTAPNSTLFNIFNRTANNIGNYNTSSRKGISAPNNTGNNRKSTPAASNKGILNITGNTGNIRCRSNRRSTPAASEILNIVGNTEL